MCAYAVHTTIVVVIGSEVAIQISNGQQSLSIITNGFIGSVIKYMRITSIIFPFKEHKYPSKSLDSPVSRVHVAQSFSASITFTRYLLSCAHMHDNAKVSCQYTA